MSFYLKIIIPNLDRRRDRWRACAYILSQLRFPASSITRFPSYDGSNHPHAHAMRHTARAHYDGKLPEYLHGTAGGSPTNYGWHWTFYEILNTISQTHATAYTLFLVDDISISFNYEQLLSHIHFLLGTGHPVDIIQYSPYNTKRPPLNSKASIIATSPTIIYNDIIRHGDGAVIYSPDGAKEMLAFANQNPGMSPDILFKRLAQGCHHISGAYSIPDGASFFSTEISKNFNITPTQDR